MNSSRALSRLAVPLAVAGMLFLLLLRPIYDVDIFWQLRLGELILANRGPVPVEPFAATHLGEQLPPLAWLGQAVYAQVRLVGGWSAVRTFDALLWVGGFWVVAVACRKSGSPPVAVLVAVGVGFMAAMPCASLRPQSFAALGFGLLIAVVRLELSAARTLLLAAPLFVLWQNLHPSISIAAVALAAAAGVGWIRFIAKHRPSPPWALTGLTLLAALATFATPAGLSILGVSAYNARASLALGVNEWLPPWVPANRAAGLTFAAAVVVTGWLLIRNPSQIAWEELAPVLVLFALTLTAHRFALFWGIAVVPVVARCLTTSKPNPPPPSPSRKERDDLIPSPDGGGVSSVPEHLPLTLALFALAAILVRPTHFHESLPLTGVEKLKETGVSGTVYCHYPWGGPLIDVGYPGWAVAFDGRYYRYSPEEWESYAAAVRGEIGPAAIDRVYHPAAYFLRPGADDKLISALRTNPEWREVHADKTSVAFVRAKSR